MIILVSLIAGLRWPVEEDFRTGKDNLGLDQCQARFYTAIQHIVLVMAALAICAVAAALLRDRTDAQPPPPAPQARHRRATPG